MINQNPKNKNKKPLVAGMGYDARQGQVGKAYDVLTDFVAQPLKILPLEARTYVRGVLPSFKDEVLGSKKIPTSEKSPIGGENFRKDEIGQINQAISNSMRRLGRSDKGMVDYNDYDRQGKYNSENMHPLAITLGRFSWEKLPNGDVRVFDTYDFQNSGRKKRVHAINQQKKREGLLPTVLGQLGKAAMKAPYNAFNGGPNAIAKDVMGNMGMIFAGDEKTAKGVDFIYRPSTYETFHTPVIPETGKRPDYGYYQQDYAKRLADMNPPEAYVEIVGNMIKTNDVKNIVKTKSVQKKVETKDEE